MQTKTMIGISPHVDVTMQDLYERLHHQNREAPIAALTAVADPQRRALYEVDYRTIGREDGIVRWVAATGRGVFDAAGKCSRVTGTAIDITPRKVAEEELRELNETLERRIAEAIAKREEVQKALLNLSENARDVMLEGGQGDGPRPFHGAWAVNGALTLQRSPGLGTRVELWLPRSAAEPAAPLRIVEAAEPRLTRGTALLVDDEQLVCTSTSSMLTWPFRKNELAANLAQLRGMTACPFADRTGQGRR